MLYQIKPNLANTFCMVLTTSKDRDSRPYVWYRTCEGVKVSDTALSDQA